MMKIKKARLSLFALFAAVALAVAGVIGAAPAPAAETTVANNLAVPVIWSDGPPMTLNGTYGAPTWNGATGQATAPGGSPVTVWLQQDPGNTWQAETTTA